MGTCSHSQTLEAVNELVQKNLGAGPLMRDAESVRAAEQALSDGTAQISVEGIRTVSRDDTVRRSTCAGQMRMKLPAGTFERLAENLIYAAAIGAGGWSRDGQTLSVINTVAYTVQPTDDQKHVYVELQGANDLVHGAGLLAVAAAVTRESNSAPGSAALPPTTPAVARPTPPVATATMCADLDLTITTNQLDCEGRRYKAADDQLNAAYKEAMSRVSPDRQKALRAEQRDWLARRDPECTAEATKDDMGGTAADLGMVGCQANRTEARRQQVTAFR